MEEKFELVAGAREGVGVGRRAKGAMGSEKRVLKEMLVLWNGATNSFIIYV